MLRYTTALSMVALTACATGAFAASTEIMLFNLAPGASYQVRRNSASADTRVADRVGNLALDTNASPGDRFEFLSGGISPGSTTPPNGAKARGVIVPNGYWADDASRPLEIRDMPGEWCVRIFDTSGSLVRRHVNLSEGTTWLWNFRNDNGQRVAPALYLVRVTDGSGTVQQAGRFLVQSGQ